MEVALTLRWGASSLATSGLGHEVRRLPGMWPTQGKVSLFDPGSVAVTRYCYRGAHIASPWSSATTGTAA